VEGLSRQDEVSSSTVNDYSMALIDHWLNNCLKKHTSCQPTGIWYPTRVLRIDEEVGKVYVQITAESQPTGPYMTLSHCWGQTPPLMLNDANLEDFKNGIPISSLPKTFAHAVAIARMCGVTYLWIDSLCIIQGSEVDWRKEAGRMGDVYNNSWCNIAATASSNSRGGCFYGRVSALVEPILVECVSSGSVLSQPEDAEKHLIINPDLWREEIDSAPLSNRAWVLQERCLAPRQLHFGAGQVSWECRESVACETYPGGLPFYSPLFNSVSTRIKDLGGTLEKIRRLRRNKKPEDVTDLQEALGHAYWLWSETVTEYSRCQLTFATDKLVAMSGLAKTMKDGVDDTYLAGLWKRFLPQELLWHTTSLVTKPTEQRGRGPAVRPRPLRAPTWSWASTEADIEVTVVPFPDDSLYKCFIDVLEAHIQPVTEDETGQIVSGVLRLRGHLVKAEVYIHGDYKSSTFSLKIGDLVIEKEVVGGVEIDNEVFLDEAPSHAYPGISVGKDISCMPVFCGLADSGDITWLEGILLQPVDGGECFERFGYFRIENSAGISLLRPDKEECIGIEQEVTIT
jgi:hypothetical protein